MPGPERSGRGGAPVLTPDAPDLAEAVAPAPAAASPLDGPLLAGRYRLEGVLRRAPATTTYAGEDLQGGQAVVVKELRIGDLSAWKEYDLFQREVETLRGLLHPGLPRLVDHFQVEAPGDVRVYLVMTRLPGESLDRRLGGERSLEPAEARRVLAGLLDILEYLHAQSPAVVHRDIKPSNVLLDEDRVYLVDFGGVRRLLPGVSDGSTMVGTFGYLAPEQLHGEATPASDLYSLGATLLALLEGCEASDLPRKGLRIDVDALGRVPPDLVEVARALTEPDPAERLRTVAEVRAALARSASWAAAPARGSATTLTLPATLDELRSAGYWAVRRLLRWGLVALCVVLFATGLTLDVLRRIIGEPFFGDLAMAFSIGSVTAAAGAALVKTRKRCQRRLLRLARKQNGRVHVSEVVEKLRLPPVHAEGLLEDLCAAGLARRDPRQPGEYRVGPQRRPT